MAPFLTPPTARQVSPALVSPPHTCAQSEGWIRALIIMGLKASRVSEGKKRLSTTTLTCLDVDVTDEAESAASKAFHTPAHLERQREVEPQVWK